MDLRKEPERRRHILRKQLAEFCSDKMGLDLSPFSSAFTSSLTSSLSSGSVGLPLLDGILSLLALSCPFSVLFSPDFSVRFCAVAVAAAAEAA
jgi:hypothetical protein